MTSRGNVSGQCEHKLFLLFAQLTCDIFFLEIGVIWDNVANHITLCVYN